MLPAPAHRMEAVDFIFSIFFVLERFVFWLSWILWEDSETFFPSLGLCETLIHWNFEWIGVP